MGTAATRRFIVPVLKAGISHFDNTAESHALILHANALFPRCFCVLVNDVGWRSYWACSAPMSAPEYPSHWSTLYRGSPASAELPRVCLCLHQLSSRSKSLRQITIAELQLPEDGAKCTIENASMLSALGSCATTIIECTPLRT